MAVVKIPSQCFMVNHEARGNCITLKPMTSILKADILQEILILLNHSIQDCKITFETQLSSVIKQTALMQSQSLLYVSNKWRWPFPSVNDWAKTTWDKNNIHFKAERNLNASILATLCYITLNRNPANSMPALTSLMPIFILLTINICIDNILLSE